MLGELQPDAGDCYLPAGLTLAHMAQEVGTSDQSVIDYVLDGDKQLRRVQAAIAREEEQGATARLGELHAELDNLGGYSANARAEQLLAGLGFSQAQMQQAVNELSGGWRIRLNLAQALMCPSDILLLDEPTNHLDLDATLWLEQWLKSYPGTLLLISHDRDFIDQVVSHIVHLHQLKLDLYKGQYSSFEQRKAEKLAQQQAQYEKQQQRIAEIDSFVRRFKAKASKAKQAQSRLKELERMETISAAHIDSPFSFRFRESQQVSHPLLSLKQACCGYGDKPVLTHFGLTLSPGDRIGLLGPNGAGKSTLIKTLTGSLPLLSGETTCGEHLKVGYFAQHQLEALDLSASPLQHILRLSDQVTDQEARNYLGSFGFNGDRALEPVALFSGGEKARVALALIAWQQPNLLLLDEPTNHLDLEVRHALTLALQSFNGAVILVSHDRHLLRNTVDRFMLVADGTLRPFDGDLNDYQRWLNDTRTAATEDNTSERSERSLSAAERKEQKREAAEQRKRLSPMKKQLAALEIQLDQLQSTLAELETRLADNSLYQADNKDTLKALLTEQAEAQQTLDETELAWMEASESLEALEEALS